jgi:hypothetical protein
MPPPKIRAENRDFSYEARAIGSGKMGPFEHVFSLLILLSVRQSFATMKPESELFIQ